MQTFTSYHTRSTQSLTILLLDSARIAAIPTNEGIPVLCYLSVSMSVKPGAVRPGVVMSVAKGFP